MNSHIGNQEQTQKGAEAATDQPQDQPAENQDEVEVRVTDKRRFTPDGQPGALEEDQFSDDGPAESQAAVSEIEMLQTKLKEAEEKLVDAERQVLDFSERFRHVQAQLLAETNEQRARMQRTFDQKLEAARGDLVASLLDTLDNLKRAVAAAEKGERKESDFNALLDGVRATANMFEAKMQNLGLSAVPGAGEEFNPEIHEAVEIVAVPKDQDNRVFDVFQTGYRFGNRLLRPARVRVGRASD
jgi:molecular chaperone GrpE